MQEKEENKDNKKEYKGMSDDLWNWVQSKDKNVKRKLQQRPEFWKEQFEKEKEEFDKSNRIFKSMIVVVSVIAIIFALIALRYLFFEKKSPESIIVYKPVNNSVKNSVKKKINPDYRKKNIENKNVYFLDPRKYKKHNMEYKTPEPEPIKEPPKFDCNGHPILIN